VAFYLLRFILQHVVYKF